MDSMLLSTIYQDPILQWIDAIRIIAGVVLLGLATKYDILNNREIPDWIWNALISVGAIMFAIHVFFSTIPLQLSVGFVVNVGVAILIGWFAYIFGFFGGADTKAITAIAVTFPVIPMLQIPVISLAIPMFSIPRAIPPWDLVLPLPIIVILTNAALVGLVFPLVLIGRNLYNGLDEKQRVISLFSNTIEVNELSESPGTIVDKHIYPVYGGSSSGLREYLDLSRNGLSYTFFEEYLKWYRNKYDESAEISSVPWRLNEFFDDLGVEDSQDFSSNPLAESIEDVESSLTLLQEQEEVHVTPAFPYLVALSFGTFLTLFIGDLLFIIVVNVF